LAGLLFDISPDTVDKINDTAIVNPFKQVVQWIDNSDIHEQGHS